jgi:glutaredoxin
MPLTLYRLPFCPYCVDVRRAADQLGIELRLVDIARDREAAAMLQTRRGRRTVPVLGIPSEGGEELLGESRDIVDYLRGLAAA